jgi:hypothetical protein
MPRKREQISVPVDPKLREALELMAQRKDRTLASQVRHILAETARRSQMEQAA